jgi:DNA polymerase-3 subunit beta
MKISVNRQELVDALAWLSPITAGKTPLPILSCISIRADKSDCIQLDASDLETRMNITVPCQVTETGGVCLDGKKIFDICKTISGDMVDILVGERKRTTVSSGPSIFTLHGLDDADYPAWNPEDADMTITLPKAELVSAINKTVFATSTDDSRFNLNAALWDVVDGSLKIVATDGHRLGIVKDVAMVLADDRRMLVPRKAMLAIRKFIEKTTSPVDVQVTAKFVVISTNNATLGCRIIDGDYPDYNKVIPSSKGISVVVDRNALSRSLAICRLMTSDRNRGVTLHIQPGKIVVTAQHPDLGDAEDQIQTDYEGIPIDFIANVEYLMEGLGTIESEKIEMEYIKDGSPVIFKPEDRDSYFNLVMPMRK